MYARRRVLVRVDGAVFLQDRVPIDGVRQRPARRRVARALARRRGCRLPLHVRLLPEAGRVLADDVRVLVLQTLRLGVAYDPHEAPSRLRGALARRLGRRRRGGGGVGSTELLHAAVRLATEEPREERHGLVLLRLCQVERVRPTAEVEREATGHRC